MTASNVSGSRLKDKVALVTGAARGTGASIARHFVAEGARVVMVDVRDALGEQTAKELGDRARYCRLDVSAESDWRSVLDGVRDREGGLDVLVNNAAILLLETIDETTQEDFERVLRVNLVGPFLGTRAALPLLRKAARQKGTASIVNVGSIDSLAGTPTTSAYSASKFALAGFTRVTALENGKFGVRANCLCPRAGSAEIQLEIFGKGVRDVSNEPSRTYDPESGPLGRRGLPADVAPAAVFLASDESAFMTGTDLLIDGGMRAGDYVDVPGRFSRLP
jgi:3alpha(or 20beta)-hydroxysteroid dehydrogenase